MNNIEKGVRRRVAWFRKALLELSGDAPVKGVSSTIASGDGMYQGDLGHYFGVGYSALRCIQVACAMAGRQKFESILDMGSGHGRVLRVLKVAYPEASLTACDINQAAVDFCARVFGATPVNSAERAEDVKLPGRYDLIWSGSLLTHLDTDRWAGYLDLMQSHLEPGGILAFSVDGRWVAHRLREGICTYDLSPSQIGVMLQGYDDHGFGYARQSPPTEGDWGLSVCRPSWVLSQLERRSGLDLFAYWERGWDDHQDVVLLKSSLDG